MYFDAHIHADVRSYEDFEKMALAGVEKAVTCAHDVYPMSSAQVYLDHFERLVKMETKRASRAGVELYAALGIHPGAIPRDYEQLLEKLPKLLGEDKVVALGEAGIGVDSPLKRGVLGRQLEIASREDKPIIVHTPGARKEKAVQEIVELVEESGIKESKVLVDHLTERSLPALEGSGVYRGLSIQPPSKLSATEAAKIVEEQGAERLILSSDISSIPSDPLALPRSALEMRKGGISREEIERATWSNAMKFYGL